MEQRIDTPNLGFWALYFTYFQIKTKNFHKS